jgi:hypothetical protein
MGLLGLTISIAVDRVLAGLPWILVGVMLVILLVFTVGSFSTWRTSTETKIKLETDLATAQHHASIAGDHANMSLRAKEDAQDDRRRVQDDLDEERRQSERLRNQIRQLGATPLRPEVMVAFGSARIEMTGGGISNMPEGATMAAAYDNSEMIIADMQADYRKPETPPGED